MRNLFVLTVPLSYSPTLVERAKADVVAQLGSGATVVAIPEGSRLEHVYLPSDNDD